ncbi:hypothetical protein [Halocatena pleomorpha]|nr:hypothetical protein [Halocatena pleomorpha]
MNLVLQSTTYPGLVNGAGYLLFFGGLLLIAAWLSLLTRSQPVQ